MKIGIELNHIVRNLNNQIIKYYKKGIDVNFDETEVDLSCSNLIDKLPFKTKKDRDNFMYIDYPYELFGCAKVMERNLVNSIIEWENELNNKDDGDEYSIIHFSLHEIALTIQSTFFFLSKTGSRVREMYFPKKGKEIWNKCDVAITTSLDVVESKPNSNNKVSVLIRTSDNGNAERHADLVYHNLSELIEDKQFVDKVNSIRNNANNSFVSKIKNNLRKIFQS